MDWAQTDPVSLSDLKDGARISFEPYFTFNPLRNVGLMALPLRIEIS